MGGLVTDPATTTVWGLFLTSALTGSLTITGVVDARGVPVAWIIAGGQSGYQAAPGAAKTGGGALNWSYANAGDQGKAVIAYLPH